MNIRYTLLSDFRFFGIISLLLKNEMDYDFRHSKTDSTYKISALQINLCDETDANNLFISRSYKTQEVVCFIQLTHDWNRALNQKLKQPYVYYYSNLSVDIYGKAHFSKIPVIGNIKSGIDISTGVIKNLSPIVIINSYIHSLSSETAEKITESQFKIIANHIESAQQSCLVPVQFNHVYLSPQIENFKLESV